jgi:hypothetical protein
MFIMLNLTRFCAYLAYNRAVAISPRDERDHDQPDKISATLLCPSAILLILASFKMKISIVSLEAAAEICSPAGL